MEPRIETIKGKKLVGKRLKMSMANSRIGELWRSFAPNQKSINNNVTDDLVSVAVYSPGYFDDFNPANVFERWAAIEVSDYDSVPPEMQTLDLPGGLYTVFDYKGASTDNEIFQYIFEDWLPQSDYTLDDRPHFEVLGDKYKNNDPDSEEEIWIPVREK